MDMPHANSDKMDTFLRDAGMDTPEVLEIMKEVLQPSVGDTNNKETSMLRVAHDQAVARQRQKLTAD